MCNSMSYGPARRCSIGAGASPGLNSAIIAATRYSTATESSRSAKTRNHCRDTEYSRNRRSHPASPPAAATIPSRVGKNRRCGLAPSSCSRCGRESISPRFANRERRSRRQSNERRQFVDRVQVRVAEDFQRSKLRCRQMLTVRTRYAWLPDIIQPIARPTQLPNRVADLPSDGGNQPRTDVVRPPKAPQRGARHAESLRRLLVPVSPNVDEQVLTDGVE